MFLDSTDVQSWLVGSTILKYVLVNEDPDSLVAQREEHRNLLNRRSWAFSRKQSMTFIITGHPLKDV